MKYAESFFAYFKKFPAFTFNDARLFLLKGGASEDYVRKFVSLMCRSERMYRITKGNYTLYRDMDLVGYPFRPFYYGLGYALTYHGVWEQQANQTVITTMNVRSGTRTIFGLNVIIKRIRKDLFFGYNTTKGEHFGFNVSDLEKTLIDTVYYKMKLEDYVYKNMINKIEGSKLNRYFSRYDENISNKVMKLLKRYVR